LNTEQAALIENKIIETAKNSILNQEKQNSGIDHNKKSKTIIQTSSNNLMFVSEHTESHSQEERRLAFEKIMGSSSPRS
jgi:hypothetical protein